MGRPKKTLTIDEEAAYQLAYEAMLKGSLGFMLSFGVRPRSLPGHVRARRFRPHTYIRFSIFWGNAYDKNAAIRVIIRPCMSDSVKVWTVLDAHRSWGKSAFSCQFSLAQHPILDKSFGSR